MIIRQKNEKYTEVKLHRITCNEGTGEEKRDSPTLSLTSAIDWGWVVNAT